MAQGTPRKSRRPQTGVEVIEDLDVLIVSRALAPGKIRFGGRVWTVRRDFTAEQILTFWKLVDGGKARDGFAMIVGEDEADEFAALVLAAPTELITPALRRLYQTTGLIKRPEWPDNTPAKGTTANGNGAAGPSGNAPAGGETGSDGTGGGGTGEGESSAS